MAENKNQHYVPRVYLRPFTYDGEGAAINLFNIDRMKPVQNASAKGQCSRTYFYGKNQKLERAINGVENPYGEVVQFLTSEQAEVNVMVQTVLLRFVYLQFLRTDAASQKAAEMNFEILDLPCSSIPIPDKRERIKAATQIAMQHYASSMGIVDDLKVCIARNHTNQSFVTSDDPAVLTNRLFFQRKPAGLRSFGVGKAGIVFILPLSPLLCAIFYDPAVYYVPHRAGWLDVSNPSDIDALNQHQIINCKGNIYFKDWESRQGLISKAQEWVKLRPLNSHEIVHAGLDYSDEWGSRFEVKDKKDLREGEESLVHFITKHPKPARWPSFLRFRNNATAYSNSTGRGLTRRWCLDEGYVTGGGYRKVRV